MEPDALVQCPYDRNHQVRVSRLPYHLVRCQQNNPQVSRTLATCPFNARHRVPRALLRAHVTSCPDKLPLELPPDPEDTAKTAHTWQPPPCQEDWDAGEAPRCPRRVRIVSPSLSPSLSPPHPHCVPTVSPRCPHAVPTLSQSCPCPVPTLSPRCPHAVPVLSPRCPCPVPTLSPRCPLLSPCRAERAGAGGAPPVHPARHQGGPACPLPQPRPRRPPRGAAPEEAAAGDSRTAAGDSRAPRGDSAAPAGDGGGGPGGPGGRGGPPGCQIFPEIKSLRELPLSPGGDRRHWPWGGQRHPRVAGVRGPPP